MLDSMRRGAQHIVAKIFFAFLAIMFVVWGVGDVFRGSSSTYAAKVGKTGVTHAELDNVVQNEIARYAQVTGKKISEEEAEKLGVKNYALNQLVRNKMLLSRVEDLNLVAGKKAIAEQIYKNEAFFDESGKFDKEKFKSLLKANGLNEERFIKSVQQDMATATLMSAITAGVVVPEAMAMVLYNYNNETRTADLLTIPADTIKEMPEPSETDLVKFYQENQERFSVPEMRAVTYVTFNISKVKDHAKPSEQEIQAEYERNIDQYKTESSRDVVQYLFSKEEEAAAAYEKISKGDVAGFSANKSDLGKVTETALPHELGEVIFSLKKDEISKPVKSELGWHIFAVKSIEPEKTKDFEEVRSAIEKDLASAKISDEFYKFGNQVEDEFASGASMEDVAKKFDLTIHKIASIDTNGNGANGSKVTDLPEPMTILPVIFGLDAGRPSSLTLLSDNSTYVIASVDSITPKRIKALDEAKGDAITMWKGQEKTVILQRKAKEIAEKIKAGEDVAALSTRFKLKLTSAKEVKRPGEAYTSNSVPDSLATELFTLKTGGVTDAYLSPNGEFVVAKLVKVNKTNIADNKSAYEDFKISYEDNLIEDILSQYMGYLESLYPVSVLVK